MSALAGMMEQEDPRKMERAVESDSAFRAESSRLLAGRLASSLSGELCDLVSEVSEASHRLRNAAEIAVAIERALSGRDSESARVAAVRAHEEGDRALLIRRLDALLGATPADRSLSDSNADTKGPTSYISAKAFSEYLAAKGETRFEVVGARQLTGGFSKVTTLVECTCDGARSDLIIRQISAGRRPRSLLLEFPLIEALYRQGVPVAEPLWVEPDDNPLGGPFIASRRASGEPAGTIWGATAITSEACLSIARTFARLHTVDIGDLALPVSPRLSAEHLLEMLDWQERTLINRGIQVDPLLARLLTWLQNNIPAEPWPASVVHGDASPANIMMTDGHVTALIDWEVAHLGDSAEELAFLKSSVEPFIPWDDFVAEYVRSGGNEPDDTAIQFYSVWADVWRYIGTLWMGQDFERTGRYSAAVARYVNGPQYLRSALLATSHERH
jgi:prepilin-type processing-associated H-X9-DG protein